MGAENWGKGYCTEAVRAMIHYGFRQLGLCRINARCDDENIASKHVMLRCGMRRRPAGWQAGIARHKKSPGAILNVACDGPKGGRQR
ncbi:GNAT family N-acetyltransferase [Brenneria sp. g21c3]|uniref:GNAT family N-acetyltransferase n=1 Tax=Brenneria sp. g21c3 TaxID=3093893 RepID=UPI0032EE5E37